MSGIPTNIIHVQFPDGDGEGDFGPMLDVLKGIQVNVGSLNNNVKAILEVLKRMSSIRGGGAAGSAGAVRGVSAAASQRMGSRARFNADIMEYRQAIRSGGSLADIMRGSHAELLEQYKSDRGSMSGRHLRAAMRLRGVELFGESVSAQRLAAEERARAQEQIKAQREALRAQREQAKQAESARKAAARAQMAEQANMLRGAKSRMSNTMASRLFDLRKRAAMPGASVSSLGLTEEEQAVLSGQASPSGLPGTRAFHRGIAGIVGGLSSGGAPAATGATSVAAMAGGIMRMVTMIGRGIAVVTMIVNLIGKIIGSLNAFSRQAAASRAYLGQVDPVFATMESQVRITDLQTRIRFATNPGLRSIFGGYTAAQMATMVAMRPIEYMQGAAGGMIGTYTERIKMSAASLAGGLLMGDRKLAGLGFLSFMQQVNPFYMGLFSLLGVNPQAALQQRLLAGGPGQVNGLFLGPLRDMTGGRFEPNTPYMGKNANASNWWTGRP